MQFSFYKYHGAGNDFIIADNRTGDFPITNRRLIKKLCDRNFGIGGDGLMLLEDKPGFDFHMRYFNSDGLEGSLCGNGGRCIVHFASETGIIKNQAFFSGSDGAHEAVIDTAGMVSLKLMDVGRLETEGDAYVIDTGSPHYVLFTGKIDSLDVVAEGRKVRYSQKFVEKGINVNFAEKKFNRLMIRTYERGVENETLACGTGSVAAALCSSIGGENGRKSVPVETRGGHLEVSFEKTGDHAFGNIWLKGPAKMVFHGSADTDNILEGAE